MRDVAFSCDDNGVRFLKVSVVSLLSHYKGAEPIRINVFDGFGGHSAAHRDEMRELVARFPVVRLRYVSAEPSVEPYRDLILNRERSRWNVFTWTPIFTPQLLPDATGNVVHFDIDMLFNADVSELFELDLKHDLIACCYEYDKYGDNAGRVVWEKGILPSTVERYFNTGTLVFNVEACRRERTWEKIIAWYRAHYDIADRIEQDAWNALYHDRMLPLHVKWNFHDRAVKNYARWPMSDRFWLGNTPRSCLEAALEPAVLHFWGPKKPWKTSHRPYRRLYHAAMRAVGQTPPRESAFAFWYDFINRLNLKRIRRRLQSASRVIIDTKVSPAPSTQQSNGDAKNCPRLRVTKLEPIKVACAWPVFRGETEQGVSVFVKCASPAAIARTYALLAAAPACSLLPQRVEADVPALEGQHFLTLAWRAVQRVNAEDMTDAQADALLRGACDLLKALAKAPDVQPPLPEDDPAHQYEIVSRYAQRFPWLRRCVAPLLAIPPEDRAYGARPRVTIHGDFQPKNYGFSGEALGAVFDFDEITTGLACEDLAYAFTERARRLELSTEARRRLVELFRRIRRASPWSVEDWRFAINHGRLRIAARRIERRPRSPIIALDVARRDRPLADFLRAALEEVSPC